MEPERPFCGQVFSVSELNGVIKQMLEGVFAGIFVEGEISNLREAASGHIYFDLKDKNGILAAVLFKGYGWRFAQMLEEGLSVRVLGDVSCYAKQGRYQLVVKSVEPLSRGKLFLEFEKLKQKLAAEGLFDERRKKPIPPFPHRIGVVTSPTGAAVRDILSVLRRRSPNLEVVVAPVLVQGDEAAAQIAQAIADFNRFTPRMDVLLVGRGGGSMEDLWAFNEEPVARAIAASQIPVISCVGHEIDFTIADFVADLRAPTPSAAAELVVKNSQNTRETVHQFTRRMAQAVSILYERAARRLESALACPVFKDPSVLTREREQRVDELTLSMQALAKDAYHRFASRFSAAQNKLAALNPQAVLKRGYSITRNAQGQIISQVLQTREQETIYIQVKDGTIRAEVK